MNVLIGEFKLMSCHAISSDTLMIGEVANENECCANSRPQELQWVFERHADFNSTSLTLDLKNCNRPSSLMLNFTTSIFSGRLKV